MKIFALILSFIILSLSSVPCIDGMKDDISLKTEISNNCNSHQQSDFDHCSPFCSCQCCHNSFYSSNTLIPIIKNELSVNYSNFTPVFYTIDIFDFFIPPKS